MSFVDNSMVPELPDLPPTQEMSDVALQAMLMSRAPSPSAGCSSTPALRRGAAFRELPRDLPTGQVWPVFGADWPEFQLPPSPTYDAASLDDFGGSFAGAASVFEVSASDSVVSRGVANDAIFVEDLPPPATPLDAPRLPPVRDTKAY